MKIILINPSIREHHRPYNFPVGIGIIAAILVQSGYEVKVIDQNGLRISTSDLLNNIRKEKNVGIIGIGGMITIYSRIKELTIEIRKIFPNVPLVIGGGITIDPNVIFSNMPVDYLVHGEGEHSFKELCDAIAMDDNNLFQIAGISYFRNGKVVSTSPRPIERNLDKFPMPAYHLFPTEKYFKNNVLKNLMRIDCGTSRCATILWSRGCPNQCTFCWRMMGVTVRYRSIDLVMDEIKFLRSKYGVDSYLFLDECINASYGKATEFAKKLIEKRFSAPWYSHARVSNFNQELAQLFKKSGCAGLNFGIESGSSDILKKMKKNATPEQASKAVRIAMQSGIRPVCTFIIGMPGETIQTAMASLNWIRENKVRYYVFFYATPYPGCELYDAPLVQKKIKERFGNKEYFYEFLGDAKDFILNLTDLSDSELIGLKRKVERLPVLVRIYRLISQPYRWEDVVNNLFRKVYLLLCK